MSRHKNQKSNNKRTITLPSGRVADMFAHGGIQHQIDECQHYNNPQHSAKELLHICPVCRSQLVYPLEWTQANSQNWNVTLRCPNCEFIRTDTFEQEVLDRFDEELERSAEELVAFVTEFSRATMLEESQRFIHALRADFITPEDF